MRVLIGTSGYGYREWKGTFYPPTLSSRDMLGFYSKHFETVEINNTFYRFPSRGVLASWAGQVHEEFIFSIKAPQVITHMKRLKHVNAEAERLFGALLILGNQLGPVLFQFPASFRSDRPALEAFLDLIPDGILCAFEFRHPSWLEGSIVDLLASRGCSLCTNDSDEKTATEIITPARWGYVRLRRSDYDDRNLVEWARRISQQRWDTVFVYFKHEAGARGTQLAERFREILGQDGHESRIAS